MVVISEPYPCLYMEFKQKSRSPSPHCRHQHDPHHQHHQQHHHQQHHQQPHKLERMNSPVLTKELIGNAKEFRMEHNKHNLRIIGNGNRIRIGHNTGSIDVIGNNTRLKIVHNCGHIKYTGNDGRICFGSESPQQLVDYVGVNGLLKVINSMELSKAGGKTKADASEITPEDWHKWRYLFKGKADCMPSCSGMGRPDKNEAANCNMRTDKTYPKEFPYKETQGRGSKKPLVITTDSHAAATSVGEIVIQNSVNVTIHC